MSEIQKDQGSRLFASMAGWKYPMSRIELYSGALLQKVANALRGEKDEPFEVSWPWPDEEHIPDVTPDERAALEARLRVSSALAQVRTPEAVPSISE